MHTKKLQRISSTHVAKSDLFYLHYFSLHCDVKNAIEKHAFGKVLDIGCGNKPYEKYFIPVVDEYTGCDIEQSSLQKVDIICDAKKIPLPSDEFDTIFSTQTIEHIADYQQVLNEAHRLLKPQGKIILSAPFYWPMHEAPNDYFRFTKFGLIHILEHAGFTVENIIENGGSWSVSGQSIIHSLMDVSSKNFFLRAVSFIFFRLKFITLHNLFFSWLDKIDYNTNMPMNYVVIAKK